MESKSSSLIQIVFSSILLFSVMFVWFQIDGGLIEIGGDAFGRWGGIVDYVVSGTPFGVSHHDLRWGLNLPAIGFLLLSGSIHPILYHLVMPTFGAASAVFIFWTIRARSQTISSDIACVVLVLALMTIDFSERPFSQLLPSGAAVFYMCTAIYFLKRGLTPSNKFQSVWYLLASISILFAYVSKLTMVFFGAPITGFVLVNSLCRREFLNATAFAFPIFLGILVESIIIFLEHGFVLGRIGAVIFADGSHGAAVRSVSSGPGVEIGWGFNTLTDYLLLSPLKYFEAMGKYSFIIYGAIALIFISKFRNRSFRDKDSFKDCLAWAIIGFFLLQTYVIIGVAPYVFPEKYIHARYQYPLFVLCAIFLFYLFFQAGGKSHDDEIRRPTVLLLAIAILVLAGSLFLNTNNIFSKHNNFGIVVTFIHNKVLSDWINSGGNIGYQAEYDGENNGTGRLNSLDSSPSAEIIHNYVGAIYRLDYCRRNEVYVYASVDRIFGLCNLWRPGEMVLFYYATSYEWRRPEGVTFLGKYSELVN